MSKKEKSKSLQVEILEKMGQLIASGFGIVAALAWNDFIRGLFIKLFPKPENNLIAMFLYAVFITILVVVATIQIGRLLEKAKREPELPKNSDVPISDDAL